MSNCKGSCSFLFVLNECRGPLNCPHPPKNTPHPTPTICCCSLAFRRPGGGVWRNRPTSFYGSTKDKRPGGGNWRNRVSSFYGSTRDKRPGGGNWRNRQKWRAFFDDNYRAKRPGGGVWRSRPRFVDLSGNRRDKRPGGGVWRSRARPATSEVPTSLVELAKRPGAGMVRRRHLCLPRGSSCTASPSSFWKCCDSHVCRCNIFGANCRCSRPGFTSLFG